MSTEDAEAPAPRGDGYGTTHRNRFRRWAAYQAGEGSTQHIHLYEGRGLALSALVLAVFAVAVTGAVIAWGPGAGKDQGSRQSGQGSGVALSPSKAGSAPSSAKSPSEGPALVSGSSGWNLSECPHFYLNRPESRLKELRPSNDDSLTWFSEHSDGRVAAGTIVSAATAEMDLAGEAPGTKVTIKSLRVKIKERRQAPSNGSIVAVGQCGGVMEPRYFSVDLDTSPPVVRAVPARGPNGEVTRPAVGFPFFVSKTDPEQFLVTFETKTCYCTVSLLVDWAYGARTGTLELDNKGRDFTVVPQTKMPPYYYFYEPHNAETFTRTSRD
ncbi:hypothetical protein ACWGN5_17230 [Streptomyces sp. NPDC055815]